MNDAEIVKEFLIESYESLDRLDQDLITLEKDSGNRDTLASIFRAIHSIKGTSGFLAFNQLEAVTHTGENLLSRLRDGLLKLDPEITTALLAMVDAIRQMLRAIEACGNEGKRNDEELIATLNRLLQARADTAAPPKIEAIEIAATPARLAAEQSVCSTTTAHASEPTGNEPTGSHRDVPKEEAPKAIPAEDIDASSPVRAQSVTDSTIRVDVGRLDRLMNRVGELVLLRNQIVQYTNSIEDAELMGTSQRLNLLTTELQESVLKTRMQPIGNIWSKFPRMVRDLALRCGKQVRIEMEGQETEVDKTIIEAIKDPLTHLVRNAIDHGIEPFDVRRAARKNPEGLLFLRAFQEGGHVNIEVTDDGSGVDYGRIRNQAIDRGLLRVDQAARTTESELTNLIFLPGFSTAEKVTNLSGRGVGLDIVKTNIEKIGGTVQLQSKSGIGSTVRIKIPLTLAIMPALIVTTAGDRYAIPQVNLLELVRLEGEPARRGPEMINGAPVHRLRGKLLPVVYLKKELKLEAAGASASQSERAGDSQNLDIVVLRANDRQFGLLVDQINDTEEIVVKPLGKQLKSIHTYTGATIMGDGKVVLILDVLGLAERANVIREVRNHTVFETEEQPSRQASSTGQRKAVLLFQHGETGRIAIDLSLVGRLEEFSRDAVEIAADREVLQYRGQIMPLVHVSEVLDSVRQKNVAPDNAPFQVIVYARSGRSVGLVVDRILDIVEEAFVVQPQAGRKGILGSAVIQERVTDILDLPGLIAAAADRHSCAAAPA